MIFNLNCYDDYTNLLSKTIKAGNLDMFKMLIKEKKYDNYKRKLFDDNIIKERLINSVLKTGDENFSLNILEFFEVVDELPDYDDISELLYMIDNRYENNLINKRKNIYYIFNNNNFEEHGSMEDLYKICEDEEVFKRIKRYFEDILGRKFMKDENEYVLERSRRYREYIDTEFQMIINEIKLNDDSIDSEGDCYGILYEYLGHRPSKWEVKLLWKSLI